MNLLPPIIVAIDVSTYLLFEWFCRSVLKNKYPVWSIVAGTILLGVVAPQLCVGLSGILSFAIANVCFIAYLAVCYEGSVREKVLVYCAGYLTVNLGQLAAAALLGMINSKLAALNVYTLVISTLITFGLLFVVSRAWKSVRFVIGSSRFLPFFLLPLSQFAMVMLSVVYLSKFTETNYLLGIGGQHVMGALYCGVIFLSLIADGFFLRSMAEVEKEARKNERLAALQKENELSYEYIKSMESDIEKMRRFRHDLTNMLTSVQLAIESKESDTDGYALELIRQMTAELDTVADKRYCENNLINCILSHEERMMCGEGIDCELRAEVPAKLGVNELDLCRMLHNLFDNARQCCLGMDESERLISSNMRVCDGYLYIVVRNSRPSGTLSVETDKENRTEHGLGLSIMRGIAQRSGGELILSDEGNAVTVTATMAWKEEDRTADGK